MDSLPFDWLTEWWCGDTDRLSKGGWEGQAGPQPIEVIGPIGTKIDWQQAKLWPHLANTK